MKYFIRTIRMKGTVKHLPPITYGVGNRKVMGLLVTMIPDKRRASQYVKDLESGAITELELVKFVHQNHKVNNLRGYGKVAGAGQLLLQLGNNQAATTGRITAVGGTTEAKPRRMGLPNTFQQAYGTVASMSDPRTKAFMGIAKGIGLDAEDLQYTDTSVIKAIENLVDTLNNLKMLDDDDGNQGDKADTGYGVPDVEDTATVETDEPTELDTWDVLAGRRRVSQGGSSTKREYVPDSVDRVEDF